MGRNRKDHTARLGIILRAVVEEFEVDIEVVQQRFRGIAEIALVRHVGMYLSRHILRASFPAIGAFYKRDHATVMNGVTRITHLRKRNADLDFKLLRLERKIQESFAAA